MLIQLLLWGNILFVSAVFGLAVLKLLRYNSGLTAPDAVLLLGFVVLCVACGYCSLWVPLDGCANVAFTLLALLLLGFVDKDARGLLARTCLDWRALDWSYRVGMLGILIIVLAYAAQAPGVYDSGLYHIQAIQWAKTYPVVPGLGNLHGRFAFNAHSFLVEALFSGHSTDRLFFPCNSFLLTLLCLRIISETRLAIKDKKIQDLVFFLVLGALSLFLLVRICHSPTPDVFVAVILIFACVFAYKTLKYPKADNKASLHLTACGLLALAPSIKLSAVMGLALIPVFFKINKHLVLRLGLLISIVLLPFFLRNIFLSGYLIFPFPAIDLFEFDWKIPLAEVLAEKRYIETWARIVDYDVNRIARMSLLDWLPIWWRHQSGLWKAVLLLGALLPFLMLRFLLQKNYAMTYFCAALSFNLLFWFVTAPDTRFAMGFLVVGAAVGTSAVSGLFFSGKNEPETREFWSFATWIPTMLFLGIVATAFVKIELDAAKLYRPARIKSQSDMRPFNRTGLSIFIPAQGERCFDCPLPCAPLLNERLELRGDGLRDGFKTN
jgi:hypothetical protein